MLIKLQVEQVGEFWDLVKLGYITANKVPQEIEFESTKKLLVELLTGGLISWIIYEEIDGKKDIYATLITRVIKDSLYGVNVLSVESLYAIKHLTDELVDSSLTKLIEFARDKNCKMFTAETVNPRVKYFLERNNSVEYRSFYYIPIGV